jgi:hypothetical protein
VPGSHYDSAVNCQCCVLVVEADLQCPGITCCCLQTCAVGLSTSAKHLGTFGMQQTYVNSHMDGADEQLHGAPGRLVSTNLTTVGAASCQPGRSRRTGRLRVLHQRSASTERHRMPPQAGRRHLRDSSQRAQGRLFPWKALCGLIAMLWLKGWWRLSAAFAEPARALSSCQLLLCCFRCCCRRSCRGRQRFFIGADPDGLQMSVPPL